MLCPDAPLVGRSERIISRPYLASLRRITSSDDGQPEPCTHKRAAFGQQDGPDGLGTS